MSERLRQRFADPRPPGEPLFIPYVTAGYPRREDTVPILLAMEEAGAGVIELGVPFSDPLADGATIQHANQVALEQGVTLRDCLAFVREARARGLQAPVLLMGYYNPILALGEARAAAEAAAAGVDGFIVVDLPPEEAASFLAECRANHLSFVPLVAPTTSEQRLPRVAAVADAFLYVVSVAGTTGGHGGVPDALPGFLDMVRRHTSLPLAVGFGISTREHVAAIGRFADAAVIGSAIIAAIDAAGRQRPVERVREFVEDVTGH
ncbi:MAG: tryptophan synthase subunit alpha [Dehalococcoidia bacterium]|nr:tryptophan synthase subunit alpha [Dehalococcoidia bacterium]